METRIGATYIDAFSISWTGKFIYMFPPFSLIWPIITKMEAEEVERAIIVTPKCHPMSPKLKLMALLIGHLDS